MKIEKTECNYQVTECDLKFGEQVTLDGELLIPTSVLDKIRSEIMKLDDINPDYPMDRTIHISRNEALQIIDKYRAGSEGREK